MCEFEWFFCQAPTNALLFTRPMLTLWFLQVNKASTSAVLDPMARVKCLVTTWASRYLAPEAVRTFSRCSCLEGMTLTLRTSRMASWRRTWVSDLVPKSMLEHGLTTQQHQPYIYIVWHESLLQQHSECSRPLSQRGGSWQSSPADWSGWHFSEHCTFHLHPSASLPGALTRSPWHHIHSWAASSGRPCRGRCPHSSESPLVWRWSATANSRAPHPGKHRFTKLGWVSHQP